MNSTPSSSKTSSTTSTGNNTLSKLRRLKIEENLLIQSLIKLDKGINYDRIELTESETVEDLDYKNTLKKLKDSYIHVRNLFDDIKTVSCSKDLLAELDLDDIKSKVLELETVLKSLKTYLNTGLTSLKLAEQEIIKQLDDISLKENSINKKRPKIPSANLNQVIPSPVRLLMTSPLKCSEVQEFQDFMKNSPNRYGGWIEYHHNIFVKYWQKHFGSFDNIDFDESYIQGLALENFIDEVLFKLQGIDKSNLILHIEWYKKYLILKERQQNAINKWKSIRKSMRKVPNHIKVIQQNSGESNKNEVFMNENVNVKKSSNAQTKPMRKLIEKDYIERLMKPTEQWLSRSSNENQTETHNINYNIENIEKLAIPNWRIFL